MKYWILISGTLHMVLLGLLLSNAQNPARWMQNTTVYQVKLMTLPAQVDNVTLEPIETIVMPESKPAPSVSLKSKQKPEPPKKIKKENAFDQTTPSHESNEGTRISIQSEHFPYNYYLEILRKRVQENWHPPYRKNTPGTPNAVVQFRIQKNGQINQVKLENGTGHFLFDQAAQRAILNIGRMPPLPSEFQNEYIIIHIEFEATI